MTLRGDFHMHTHFSHDCVVAPEALVNRCVEVGLNCIAVTDHNSIGGARAVQAAAPFTVILGEEIKSTEGEITGLFLQEEVPPGLTPTETARRVKEQGALVSVPHPFARTGRSSLGRAPLMEILELVDLIEGFNARTTSTKTTESGRAFAQEHGLITTAVSDSHTLKELGHTYTVFPEFDGTPMGFKEALREATFVERPAGRLVHLYSGFNRLRKRFSSGPRSSVRP